MQCLLFGARIGNINKQVQAKRCLALASQRCMPQAIVCSIQCLQTCGFHSQPTASSSCSAQWVSGCPCTAYACTMSARAVLHPSLSSKPAAVQGPVSSGRSCGHAPVCNSARHKQACAGGLLFAGSGILQRGFQVHLFDTAFESWANWLSSCSRCADSAVALAEANAEKARQKHTRRTATTTHNKCRRIRAC